MKNSYNKIGVAVKHALILGAGLSLATTPLSAAEDDGAREERVVITGSRIKRVDAEGVSPVVSITREEMDRQGLATVQDVIDGLTQNAGGSIDQSFTFGFTPAASSVNLRGFGFGRTLTLLDGRRMPIYPVGISGTTNFVDLSSIPTAMIERIDILTDGASAIYGSDAVSGVINIITRKDINGSDLTLRRSVTADGGADTSRFQFLSGVTTDKTTVDFIVDYWKQGALYARDRDYAGSDVANARGAYSIGGSSFLGLDTGTIYQDPNCGTPNDALGGLGQPDQVIPIFSANDTWCGFDRTAYRMLFSPSEQKSATGRVTYEINPDLSFFGRVGFSDQTNYVELEPNFYGGGFFTGFGTLVPNNGAILPGNAVNNPTAGTANEEQGVFVRRLVEYGPRTSKFKTTGVNFLAGLEGVAFDGMFDWELGWSYMRSDVGVRRNNIILSALNAEVDNGLDLFQPIPQSVVDTTSYLATRDAYSWTRGIDFSLSGDLPFELAGGPVQFAAAIDKQHQEYFDESDPITTAGEGFDGASAGGGDRDYTGVAVEFRMPFTNELELNLAVRRDSYDDRSDVGSATSPRVALMYSPLDTLKFRATWGESFRAPDMQRLFGSRTRGFVTVTDPFLNDVTVQSVNVFTGSNLALEEEQGENLNIGVVWEAMDSLTVTADYYQIELENIVAAPTAQFILNTCFNSGNLCELITRDSQGTLQGNDAFIESTAQNLSLQEITGIDLTINYDWQTELGNFNSRFSWSWVDEFTTQFDENSAPVENISLGALPENRINANLGWSNDVYNANIRVSYVDELAGGFCGGSCTSDQFIDAYTTVNLSFGYDMGDYGRFLFGVNNVTNEAPPEDPTANNWPWFLNAGGYYSAKGREFSLQYTQSF